MTLKAAGGAYPKSGILTTAAAKCSITGIGRVSIKADTVSGETSVSIVETSASDGLSTWTNWQTAGTGGELLSPIRKYIRFRITLASENASRIPVLRSVSIYDTPKPLYKKLGFPRPVLLDKDRNSEAVLENAYDVIVTSEINGIDKLEFSMPFQDTKRKFLESENQIRIVNDIYRIRTVTDEKNDRGFVVTSIYAEAAFYDFGFSVMKEPTDFNADRADVPIRYALLDTGWELAKVSVRTKMTWACTKKRPRHLKKGSGHPRRGSRL